MIVVFTDVLVMSPAAYAFGSLAWGNGDGDAGIFRALAALTGAVFHFGLGNDEYFSQSFIRDSGNAAVIIALGIDDNICV